MTIIKMDGISSIFMEIRGLHHNNNIKLQVSLKDMPHMLKFMQLLKTLPRWIWEINLMLQLRFNNFYRISFST